MTTPEPTDPISATRARSHDFTYVWPIFDITRIISTQKFKNDPSRLRVASLNNSPATPQGKHRQEGHPAKFSPYAHMATCL